MMSFRGFRQIFLRRYDSEESTRFPRDWSLSSPPVFQCNSPDLSWRPSLNARFAQWLLRLYNHANYSADSYSLWSENSLEDTPAIIIMLRQTLLFRIFYTGFFVILSFIFFILTLVTPADMIYQSVANHKIANIFIVAGVYVATFLVGTLVYASRIVTNRSVLASIPKPWVPVEEPDVTKNVRKLIVKGLVRSSLIAQHSRPRDTSSEEDFEWKDLRLTIFEVTPPDAREEERDDASFAANAVSPTNSGLGLSGTDTAKRTIPPWGVIEHPGWTAPDCTDLPNCGFEHVVNEIPHLLEAKAVSLAPTQSIRGRAVSSVSEYEPNAGATSISGGHDQVPDLRVVNALRRPHSMCFRDYVFRLMQLNLVRDAQLARDFIQLYEYARFSQDALVETEFRKLMAMSATVLNGMTSLEPHILSAIYEEQNDDDDDDDDEDGDDDRNLGIRAGQKRNDTNKAVSGSSTTRDGAEETPGQYGGDAAIELASRANRVNRQMPLPELRATERRPSQCSTRSRNSSQFRLEVPDSRGYPGSIHSRSLPDCSPTSSSNGFDFNHYKSAVNYLNTPSSHNMSTSTPDFPTTFPANFSISNSSIVSTSSSVIRRPARSQQYGQNLTVSNFLTASPSASATSLLSGDLTHAITDTAVQGFPSHHQSLSEPRDEYGLSSRADSNQRRLNALQVLHQLRASSA